MHKRFCLKPFCSSIKYLEYHNNDLSPPPPCNLEICLDVGLLTDFTHKVGATPLFKHALKIVHTGSKKVRFCYVSSMGRALAFRADGPGSIPVRPDKTYTVFY